MHYKILKRKEFTRNGYLLCSLREENILEIMRWRNKQIDVLRQKKPLTKKDQKRYFEEVVRPTFTQKEPPIMLFSFLHKGRCIGYGGLVHINWDAKRAEISFLVETDRAKDERTYDQDYSAFLMLLKKAAFEDFGLNRIFAETYNIRAKHIKILEKNGFKYEGTMRQHVKIKGHYVDSLIHGLLREEYDAKK